MLFKYQTHALHSLNLIMSSNLWLHERCRVQHLAGCTGAWGNGMLLVPLWAFTRKYILLSIGSIFSFLVHRKQMWWWRSWFWFFLLLIWKDISHIASGFGIEIPHALLRHEIKRNDGIQYFTDVSIGPPPLQYVDTMSSECGYWQLLDDRDRQAGRMACIQFLWVLFVVTMGLLCSSTVRDMRMRCSFVRILSWKFVVFKEPWGWEQLDIFYYTFWVV